MDIFKADSRPANQGDPEYFTGEVTLEPIISAPEPARVFAARVTFSPGARTAWHTHGLGQTLYVLSGIGRIQKEGEAIQEILPGDTIWIAPDEKHWHGAASDTAMCHIAIQETVEGSNAEWLEKVTDEIYDPEG
ncbi:MAG: cupin domain-containing protein [Pseudomonadota bacterium]